jgi:hypothetical protein
VFIEILLLFKLWEALVVVTMPEFFFSKNVYFTAIFHICLLSSESLRSFLLTKGEFTSLCRNFITSFLFAKGRSELFSFYEWILKYRLHKVSVLLRSGLVVRALVHNYIFVYFI